MLIHIYHLIVFYIINKYVVIVNENIAEFCNNANRGLKTHFLPLISVNIFFEIFKYIAEVRVFCKFILLSASFRHLLVVCDSICAEKLLQ